MEEGATEAKPVDEAAAIARARAPVEAAGVGSACSKDICVKAFEAALVGAPTANGSVVESRRGKFGVRTGVTMVREMLFVLPISACCWSKRCSKEYVDRLGERGTMAGERGFCDGER